MSNYRETYPTGRKHCSSCGRWRHLIDFTPRSWVDPHNPVVLRLANSTCRVCQARKARGSNAMPRIDYEHGAPGTERRRLHDNEVQRANRARKMTDDAYRADVNERWRIWWIGRNGKTARNLLLPGTELERIPVAPFLAWLERTPGVAIGEDDRSAIRRSASTGGISVKVVDRVMTRAGYVDEFFLLYPIDNEEEAA